MDVSAYLFHAIINDFLHAVEDGVVYRLECLVVEIHYCLILIDKV